MLLNWKFTEQQLPWLILALGILLGLGGWFVIERLGRPEWPGGSTAVGLTLGIVGGLLILFEFLLWPRKKKRTWRVGRVRIWMAGHIWLGLLSLPLLILHSGFRLGGSLSTILMALLLIVVLSGIWGLVFQQILPRKMMDEVPTETIYSQIDRIGQMTRHEAWRLVEATCGPSDDEARGFADVDQDEREEAPPYLVVGALRTAGRLQGNVLQTSVPSAPVPGSEPLRVFYLDEVLPFLERGSRSGSPLSQRHRAEAMFLDLKTQLDPRTYPAIDALAGACEQRRQHDLQSRMHVWLHVWLLVHLPASIALVILMFVHGYVAIKYW
ncbi:hypothetical protein [Tautonia plasticadhaerens]|uniref:Ferric reductase like transmembrane component n=1 Tax=Tautonia plasticadhaerens TaxID=2527974 RepID=A0A518H8F2_9BACT|nr:hypothetical protein [Tautonia plasticadhaerens]QDV37129.1 hypothetical protein ElP_50620 [Tautonia plasticadhaerens]